MSDRTIPVPDGFLPLLLSPEAVEALTHDEVLAEVHDAAMFAHGLHVKDCAGQLSADSDPRLKAVAHVALKLREALAKRP